MADVSARSSTSEGPAHGRAATSRTPKHFSAIARASCAINPPARCPRHYSITGSGDCWRERSQIVLTRTREGRESATRGGAGSPQPPAGTAFAGQIADKYDQETLAQETKMEMALPIIGMVVCFGGMMTVMDLSSRLWSRIWDRRWVSTVHSTQER